MSFPMRVLAFLAVLWAAPAPFEAQALAAPGPVVATERIEAQLVPLSAWAAPGSTAVVAVRQSIAPGWHTYWRNPGDSGGATTLEWRLPPGVTAGDIVWPLPQRQRVMGLTNYGYSGQVYLPVTLQIPATARPGERLALGVTARFFVCSDTLCVPEDLDLTLDVPVRDGVAPLDTRHGAAVQTVLAQSPQPAGIEARTAFIDGRWVLSATGGPLEAETIGRAWFFPFDGGVIDHAAAQPGRRGAAGVTLALTPAPPRAGQPPVTGAPDSLRGVLATDRGAWEIEARPGPSPAGADDGPALADWSDDPATADHTRDAAPGLIRAALMALLGGLLLNLMPCVFPVLAMKAAALTGNAHDPRRARIDGLAFLAGVVTTFVLLAGLLLVLRGAGQAAGWGFQLQSPAVVAGLALLMLAVGLNLSGAYHMGAGLQGAGAGPLSRLPGAAGAFLTGALAVAVAAPCVAPFMAVALGAALIMPWPAALLIFAMLGLGLGLPYLLVSLSPGLLARLPRPGPWMERLRNLLAFPMYGAALWLAWVFARQGGGDALAPLFAAGLMLALGLWLLGRAQADTAEGRKGRVIGAGALIALLAALGLAAAAARLADSGPAVTATTQGATVLPSRPWSAEAVAEARAQGRPVLVNFTADWCVTCKVNERMALTSPRVAQALARVQAVYLVGDWTRRDDAIATELARHGRSGVPLYLLYRPGADAPEILPQILTEGRVVEALSRAGAG